MYGKRMMMQPQYSAQCQWQNRGEGTQEGDKEEEKRGRKGKRRERKNVSHLFGLLVWLDLGFVVSKLADEFVALFFGLRHRVDLKR